MADELTTVLLRFEDQPGAPVTDDAAGLNPLFPANASYPSTAAAMAAALGLGTFADGWLCDEAAGNLVAAFGGIGLTASSTPTYHNVGPLGPADFAVGFDSALDAFTAASNATLDVSATDDLVIVGVCKIGTLPIATTSLITKVTAGFGNGYAVAVTPTLYGFFAGAGSAYGSNIGAHFMLGKWHVFIAAIDRATGKTCFGARALDGSETYVGGLGTITGSIAAATPFAFGSGAWVPAMPGFQLAAVYAGSGTGVAAGIPANMATVLGKAQAAIGAAWPGRESGVAGWGATFAVGNALQASDQTTGATALPRDVTVQALVRWDLAAQNASGQNGTLIARGRGDVVAEYMPFAIEFVVIDPVALTGQIRFLWQTAGGVLKTEVGGGFINPTGNYMMVTCTRRWSSPTSIVCRYYIGGQLLAEVASADGDIASSASGTTLVGARYVPPSLANYFCGAIDELRVLNYEMSGEEVRAIYNRISVSQPDGVRQFKDLLPPGLPVSDDATSRVQMDFASGGVALGYADGLIENFRQNIMPDRAYGRVQRRWEAITRQPAGLIDSLDLRRKRVLGHLGSRGGASVPSVEAALATLLQCNPTDLVPEGFDNTIRDTFTTLDQQRWFCPNGGVTVLGNELRLQLAGGGAGRWDDVAGTMASGAIVALLPMVSRPERVHNYIRSCSPAIMACLDDRTSALSTNTDRGIVIASDTRQSMVFFGIDNNAGTVRLTYQRFKLGVAVDVTPVVIAGWGGNLVTSLRIMGSAGSAFLGLNEISLQLAYFEGGVPTSESQWNIVGGVACDADMDWMGVYVRTLGAATAGGAVDLRITNASAFRDKNSDRAFFQYMYRNPALGGTPDIAGANRVFQRMRHGYTKAAVIQSLSLLCDDPASLCDSGPMGCS